MREDKIREEIVTSDSDLGPAVQLFPVLKGKDSEGQEDQWEEVDAAVTRIDTPQDLNTLPKLTLLYNPLPSGSANTIRMSCFTDFRKFPIPEIVPPVPAKIWGVSLFVGARSWSDRRMESNKALNTILAGRYVMGPKG